MQTENLQKAQKIIAERNQKAKALAQQHYSTIITTIPRARDIYAELATTGLKVSKAIFTGQNEQAEVNTIISKLKTENLSLQLELSQILVANGYPKDYLDTVYYCKICEDTGFVDGKRCKCFEELAVEIGVKKFNSTVDLPNDMFNCFLLKYYSDTPDAKTGISQKKTMSDIFDFCKDYVHIFSRHAPNVLMLGETGLGKTHLSLAIASEVTQKGYTAIYSSSLDLFRTLQNEYFGKTSINVDTMQTILDADLVVIDDLGAEFDSSFNTSCLYNIVNTRLNLNRPTIINTNLTPKEIESRYTNRVASRLLTLYKCLKFTGRDVREIKLKNNEI